MQNLLLNIILSYESYLRKSILYAIMIKLRTKVQISSAIPIIQLLNLTTSKLVGRSIILTINCFIQMLLCPLYVGKYQFARTINYFFLLSNDSKQIVWFHCNNCLHYGLPQYLDKKQFFEN